MSLLDTIKTNSIQARKSAIGKPADASESVKATLLVTLFGEASRIGKDDGDRSTTDDETLGVIRKFLKNIDETLKLNLSDSARTRATIEREVLQSYLPPELPETVLRAEIALLAAANGVPFTVRDTGTVRKALDAKFPGQINGKLLSDILKESQPA